MFPQDDSKSRFFLFAAIAILALGSLAVFFVLQPEAKEDPSIAASYKSLRKKLKHESPLPLELTADFQLSGDGHWIANGPVKDKQLEELAARNQVLNIVLIIGGDITPRGLDKLQGKRVRRLKVHYTELDKSFTEALSKLKDLERLDLRDKHIDDDVIAHLNGLPRLEELLLSESKITERGVQHIVKTFPTLEKIEISANTYFDDSCLDLLKGLKKLNNVNVSGTSVTENALLDFLKNDKINELGIGDLHLEDQFVTKLPTRLESLDLSYNPITDASIDTVSRMKNLRVFHLVGKTMVTTDGLERLKKQVPGCKIFCTKKSRKQKPEYADRHD